jgi:hypothetical protein
MDFPDGGWSGGAAGLTSTPLLARTDPHIFEKYDCGFCGQPLACAK